MVKPPLNHHFSWAIFGTVDVRCQRSRATGHWRLRAPGLSDEDWRPGEKTWLSWRISCGLHGDMALLYNIIFNILHYILHIIFMDYIQYVIIIHYVIIYYILYYILYSIRLSYCYSIFIL